MVPGNVEMYSGKECREDKGQWELDGHDGLTTLKPTSPVEEENIPIKWDQEADGCP